MRRLKVQHYRDKNESSNPYLNSLMFYYPKWKSSKRRFFKFYGLRTHRNAAFTKFVIDTKAYFFTDIFYANIMHVLSKLIYWFYFLEYYSRKLFLVRAIFSVLIRIIVFSVYPIEPLLLVYNNGSGTCYLLHLGSENSGSAHSKVNLFLRLVTLM